MEGVCLTSHSFEGFEEAINYQEGDSKKESQNDKPLSENH